MRAHVAKGAMKIKLRNLQLGRRNAAVGTIALLRILSPETPACRRPRTYEKRSRPLSTLKLQVNYIDCCVQVSINNSTLTSSLAPPANAEFSCAAYGVTGGSRAFHAQFCEQAKAAALAPSVSTIIYLLAELETSVFLHT